jgi:hypothetical protein
MAGLFDDDWFLNTDATAGFDSSNLTPSDIGNPILASSESAAPKDDMGPLLSNSAPSDYMSGQGGPVSYGMPKPVPPLPSIPTTLATPAPETGYRGDVPPAGVWVPPSLAGAPAPSLPAAPVATPPIAPKPTIMTGAGRALEPSISQLETGGRPGGGYETLGTTIQKGTHAGTQAIGRFQFMPKYIPQFTREAFGEKGEMTPEQFKASPAAQDRLFDYRMSNRYLKKNSLEDAARSHIGFGKVDPTTKMNAATYAARAAAAAGTLPSREDILKAAGRDQYGRKIPVSPWLPGPLL